MAVAKVSFAPTPIITSSPDPKTQMDTARGVDITYFSKWLPRFVAADTAVQGVLGRNLVQKGLAGEKEVLSQKEKTLFKLLLKQNPMVSDTKAFYRKKEAESKSIRFFNVSSGLCGETHYLGKLTEILEKISAAIEEARPYALIPSLGYDRLFLKQAVQELCPAYVRIIIPEPIQLLGGLWVSLKEQTPPLGTLKEKIRELKDLSLEQGSGSTVQPCLSDSLLISRAKETTSARKSASSPLLIHHSDLSLDYGINLIAAQLAYHLHRRQLKIAPSLDDAELWNEAWAQLFCHSIILRGMTAEICEFLFEHSSSLATKQIQELKAIASCTDLETFHSLLQSLSAPLAGQLKNRLGDVNKVARILGGVNKIAWVNDLLQGRITLKKVQNLARLKYKVEITEYFPSVEAAQLMNISMEQVCRSYFPKDGTKPLVSVQVNSQPLLNEDQDALFYYETLLLALLQAQGTELKDSSSFAQSILGAKEFENASLALMLKAGSFSAFGYADSYLRKNILQKLPKSYAIKFRSPQEAPTCEFFSSGNGSFTMIRTGVYSIKKDEVEKCEFVLKWQVSWQEGLLHCRITIPSISPHASCPVEEQEEIYQSF